MYLRFVHAKAEKPGRRRLGILRAPNTPSERDGLRSHYDWLRVHLPVPPPGAFSQGRGLCWFKLEARECIDRLREMAFHLEERHGRRIWQIYSRNPGLITYEDDLQIVAVPESCRGLFDRGA